MKSARVREQRVRARGLQIGCRHARRPRGGDGEHAGLVRRLHVGDGVAHVDDLAGEHAPRRHDAPAGGIAADSLAPAHVGALMFPIARAHVERVVLVSDDTIRRAQQALWESFRVVAEPGGAAATGALLAGAYVPTAGERVGVVVSGGNTTAVDFTR